MQASQRNRIEQALAAAEGEFRERLIAALRRCAGGAWGLFGQNDNVDLPPGFAERAYEDSGAKTLMALGREIEEMRNRLGMVEPFPLLARFRELRGYKTANDLGEARLAQDWLTELGQ